MTISNYINSIINKENQIIWKFRVIKILYIISIFLYKQELITKMKSKILKD